MKANQTIVLKGYFCKVNKYGRLKFRYVSNGISDGTDCETIEEYQKLHRAAEHHLGSEYMDYQREQLLGINKYGECINTAASMDTVDTVKSPVHLPFDKRGFTVAMPKWIKKIPPDVISGVGLICTVRVKVIPYNFTSKSAHNFGENIIGIQVVFESMII